MTKKNITSIITGALVVCCAFVLCWLFIKPHNINKIDFVVKLPTDSNHVRICFFYFDTFGKVVPLSIIGDSVFADGVFIGYSKRTRASNSIDLMRDSRDELAKKMDKDFTDYNLPENKAPRSFVLPDNVGVLYCGVYIVKPEIKEVRLMAFKAPFFRDLDKVKGNIVVFNLDNAKGNYFDENITEDTTNQLISLLTLK